MEGYYIVLVILGLGITTTQGQLFCDDGVNACSAAFIMGQQQAGFNFTIVCDNVDTFMECVNTALEPCDVITRNSLKSAIYQLIELYTDPVYGCELDFDDTFEYSNCSSEVTECAFFKYDAEDQTNTTEACRQYDLFVDCMRLNTSTCEGTERDEINQSIANTTETFTQCPYACGRPDLVCTTSTSTTSATTTTVFVLPSSSLDVDPSDFYLSISPSDDFYDPTMNPSMYSSDYTDFYTPALSDDFISTELFPFETASAEILATAADDTNMMETDTITSPSPTTMTTTPEPTTTTPEPTTTTAKPTTPKPTTPKPTTQKPTTTVTSTVKIEPTSTAKKETEKPTTTTPIPTTTTGSSTEMEETPSTDSGTTSVGTTDFPTPNYDNGAGITQQSLVFLVTSLLLAFLA